MIRQTTARGTSQPVSSGSSVQNKKTSGNRSYRTDFIKFGFQRYENNKMVQPQCVVCGEILANESLKPSKLKSHLDTKHPNYKCNEDLLSRYSFCCEGFIFISIFAKNNKPHTIGENLVLPAAIDLCTEILGKEAANKLKTIPASNNTVQRRIVDISENIKQQLLNRLSSKPMNLFSIQLDESTDVQNKAILSVFIRYYYDENIHEDVLYCNSLSTTTTGADIYSSLDNFFLENNIQWTNCVGVTTDGAASMTCKHVGVVRRIKEVPSPRCRMDSFESVKIINFIKCGALNGRLFYKLCEENEQNVKSLLLHSEVRWLSRRKCLFRLFQLRHEVLEFLDSKNSDFKNYFCDSKWLINEILEEDNSANVNDIKTIISLHLNQISIALIVISQKIFAKISIEELNFNTLLGTQIIELSCDKTYENKFKNETLVDFWCAVYNEYPELSINAIKKLLLFPTTYLCKKGFLPWLMLK
ncbi:zinc finger MYM-type protein 6-like [Metopolophium dirhodum]|uniref:zinc finger MYM-type protein 6-like n=1 Tax=Metopolophium dirhodum TaxID=44670 RepID=UPI00298FADB1|nr:zinc finger MYM-type protein 6-like [Metopolophium dirhodum]